MTDQWGSYIEIKGIDPIGVPELHRATKESLAHTINYQGRENIKLRKRVVELELSLSPHPFFSKPFSICNRLILQPIT